MAIVATVRAFSPHHQQKKEREEREQNERDQREYNVSLRSWIWFNKSGQQPTKENVGWLLYVDTLEPYVGVCMCAQLQYLILMYYYKTFPES